DPHEDIAVPVRGVNPEVHVKVIAFGGIADLHIKGNDVPVIPAVFGNGPVVVINAAGITGIKEKQQRAKQYGKSGPDQGLGFYRPGWLFLLSRFRPLFLLLPCRVLGFFFFCLSRRLMSSSPMAFLKSITGVLASFAGFSLSRFSPRSFIFLYSLAFWA